MSTMPVARYLKDVGPERGRGDRHRSDASGNVDVLALVAEARALGAADARVAAAAEIKARLEAEKAEAERRLALERETWAKDEGERLSAAMTAQLRDIELRLANQVARVLKPLLQAAATQRAVEGLASVLEGLLSKGELPRIEIRGPNDLIQQLGQRLEGKLAAATLIAAPGCDLRVTVDETILETRIGNWVQAIEADVA